jgi:SPP1 gp7 family putative phage head morphogenesis protein
MARKAAPDLSYAIGLPPEKAIEYFTSKGYTFSWDWQDVWQEAHAKAFTVAKALRMDVLQDIREMVQKSLDEGITFARFKKELTPKLQAKGWWGKEKIIGDEEGGKVVQLGSPRRLHTIYQTNLQTAYMAGRYAQQMENVADRPYWQYVAVLDSATRPAHRRLHGKVFPYDDPFWDAFYPPNGWNCRCRVRALSAQDVKDRDLEVSQGKDQLHEEEVLVSRNTRDGVVPGFTPGTTRYKKVTVYTDPKTGLTVYPDAGWSYNPGKAWLPDLGKYDPDLRPLFGGTGFDPTTLRAIPNTQFGSNPGGLYEDPTGKKYYIKFYKDADQARTEWAAARIYKEMDLEAPTLHLAEMKNARGKMQLALVSEWRDDLKRLSASEMLAYKKDLAETYHAAVIVKNWDVVGLDYDNLVLTGNSRLMVVDSGGTFRFRAQGKPKPYGADLAEIKSLRDVSMNRQTGEVFNRLFAENVFLEEDGARVILKLKRSRVQAIFTEAGFETKTVDDLTDALMARRELMIDRYNLDGRYGYRGFGEHMEKFKEWGTAAWNPRITGGMINGSTDAGFQAEMQDLVRKFEDYVNTTIHRYSRGVARGLFSEWSGSSSSAGGAAIKVWAEERFGFEARYHHGLTDRAGLRSTLETHLQESLSRARLPRETVFRVLDAEYEFHQYYLRRLLGYDEFKTLRYVGNNEYRACLREGLWEGNVVQSVTAKRGGFGGAHLVELSYRVEDVIKTYYQGTRYMHYGAGESEYIVLGRRVSARTITR